MCQLPNSLTGCDWLDLLPYALFAIAGIGLVALLIMFVITRRRAAQQAAAAAKRPVQQETRVGRAMVGKPASQRNDATIMGTLEKPGRAQESATQIMMPPVEAHTQVMRGSAPKTMVLQKPLAQLTVSSGPAPHASYPISEGSDLMIGRAMTGSQAHILLDSPYVSRRHASVQCNNGVLQVVDQGTPGGTQVNGAKLAPGSTQTLNIGDTLVFADVTLELRSAT